MNAMALGERAPVLFVRAGPVGLLAAVRVRVIDEHTSHRKRIYPVVLQPRTLQLLDSLGVSDPLSWQGRYIKHLAVYADNLRRVVLESRSISRAPQHVLRQSHGSLGRGPNAPHLLHAPAWVSRHLAQLLPSLPVSGDDLDDGLEQLRVRAA